MATVRWVEAMARRADLAVTALATLVLIGWATGLETLQSVVPGGPSMKPNAALCFLMAGAALTLSRRDTRLARFARSTAAIAIVAIAAITPIEQGTGLDLGLDELLIDDRGTPDDLHPGRMEVATAVGFLFTGASLLFAGLGGRTRWTQHLAQTLAGGAVAIGAAAIAGYVFGFSFLYTWYAFGSIAVHTAAGFVVAGAGALAMARAGAQAPQSISDDERIVRTAAVLLVLAASAIGISGIVALEAQVQRVVDDGLRSLLNEQITEIQLNVELRRAKAVLVASRPGLRGVLEHLAAAPDDRDVRRDAERRLGSFRAHGFSALAFALADGRGVAQAGPRIAAPTFAMPVAADADSTLLWRDGLYLRDRFPIGDGARGYLVTEQPLDRLNHLLVENQTRYASAEFLLCRPTALGATCFPSRISSAPITLVTGARAGSRLVSEAAQGLGIVTTLDYRGHRVIGAYAPLTELGLIAVLKIDLDEAYAPLRRQLALAAALVVSVTAGGVLLMRSRVQPLAAGLDARVRARTAELEETSARLRDHEARLAAIVDSAMDAVVAIGTDQRIVMFNTAAEAMFRCSAGDALGQPLDRFIPAALRAAHREHVGQFATAGLASRRMGQLATVSAVRADGEEFPVEASISHVSVGSDTLLTAILRDMTERHRAERAQQLFSERLQALHAIDRSILTAETPQQTAQGALDRICTLLDLPSAAVAEYDQVEGTGRWLAISGPSRPNIDPGQTFSLEPMGDMAQLACGHAQTIALAGVMHVPCARNLAALGLRACTVVPLIVEGELIGSVKVGCVDEVGLDESALSVVREVADQLAIALRHARFREQIVSHAADLEREVALRTHELGEANAQLCRVNDRLRDMLRDMETARREQIETKDRFLSHVSHELRAPLTAIYQFSTILQDGIAGPLTSDQLDCVEVLVRNAEQLRGMIDDLLEATRADMAVLTLRRQRGVSIGSLAEDVVQTLRPAASEKHVALIDEVPGDMPPVEADPARVRQILVNLVDNAIKFSTAGDAVRIEAHPDTAPDFVRISVVDEGPGLTAEERQRVFNRLYQVPGAPQTARDGLGLGLYICKELVQRHGGSIWADGNGGRGSTFSFTLPVDVGAHALAEGAAQLADHRS